MQPGHSPGRKAGRQAGRQAGLPKTQAGEQHPAAPPSWQPASSPAGALGAFQPTPRRAGVPTTNAQQHKSLSLDNKQQPRQAARRLQPWQAARRALLSSMNFFHPQSCSFLQKRCSVSLYLDFFGSWLTTAMVNCRGGAGRGGARRVAAGARDAWAGAAATPRSISPSQPAHGPNPASTLVPAGRRQPAPAAPHARGGEQRRRRHCAWYLRKVAPPGQQLVVVSDAEEEGEVVGHVAAVRVDEEVPAGGTAVPPVGTRVQDRACTHVCGLLATAR